MIVGDSRVGSRKNVDDTLSLNKWRRRRNYVFDSDGELKAVGNEADLSVPSTQMDLVGMATEKDLDAPGT